MAWFLAMPAIHVGLDHLYAWRQLRLVANSEPIFAHLSLIRAAMEGLIVARWMLDPSIGGGERLARAVGAQLVDYRERLKHENLVGDDMPKPTGQGRTAAQRLDELTRHVEAEGVEPAPMPSTTRLFADHLFPREHGNVLGESFFRLISGVVHAKVWSLYGLTDLGAEVRQGEEQRAITVTASPELAYVATAVAMRLAAQTIAELERYASP
jgi:hypothetical protein